MEITMRWHRLLRALVGIVFFGLGLGAAVFIFSNVSPVDVHWRVPSNNGPLVNGTLSHVSLWLLAAVPLLVGALFGYLYQSPARMHHFREHMRHMHRVHELEHELKEVRTSLDKLLMMPEDGRPAVPAALMAPIEHRTAVIEEERDPRLPDEPSAIEVLAATPVNEAVKAVAAVPAALGEAKAAKPRRRFFGGLRAEVAEAKLPAAIPATIVTRPRRDDKAANGKSKPVGKRIAKPVAKRAAKPASKPAAGPVRNREAKKSD
jgi:hypothetical protein